MSTSKSISTAAFCFAALLPAFGFAQESPQAQPAPAPAVAAEPKSTSAAQDLVTIGSLADAQRKALLAKERETRAKAATPKEAQESAKKIVMPKLPPPKTRLVYGIYTNADGELVAEIVHNDQLKQVRDGEAVGGTVIEIDSTSHVTARSVSDPSCSPKPKSPCGARDLRLRIGQAF